MSIELFLHNQIAYEAAWNMMQASGKAAIIHPTGTGKSFIAFKLAEDYPDCRICWLAPSEYIYRTQVENLQRSGGNNTPDFLKNIKFLTYAKLMKEEEMIQTLHPDYIILDEFHRCGALEWGKGVQKLLSAYPHAKILGLSATNIRYLDNQRNMAEELFDGWIASEMTLGEAIAKQILPAPTYVLSLYSYEEELKKWSQKVSAMKNDRLRLANEEILQKLRRAVENSQGLDEIFARHMKKRFGKYIVFCANKEHMEEMKRHVKEWFAQVDTKPRVYTVYFHHAGASKEFSDFKEDDSEHLKLLFCIDMLNEGVHVEDIDGVILLRPTVSPILYLQQIGRSLSAGKDTQPVIFDIVNNFESLCCIDYLKKEIEMSFAILHDSPEKKDKFQQQFQIIDEVRDCRILFEQLKKNLAASWDIYYEAAKKYRNTYGNLKIPKGYVTEDGLTLGTWILTQRRVRMGKISGNLTKEQIERLNRLGMIWNSLSEENWKIGYQELSEYYQKYGNTDIKANYVTESGYKLGKWVSNLRQKRKQDSCFLSEEKIQKLDALGMIWDKNAHQWERNYRAARQYYEAHEDLQVPASYRTAEGIALGNWIQNLKQLYAGKKGTAALSEEQIRQMEEIGMIWDNKSAESWKRKYALAKKYYQEHGSLDVPSGYCVEGIDLGKWIAALRLKRKNPDSSGLLLTAQRIRELDDIGMIWNKDTWEMRYQIATEYYRKHGNLKIPQNYVSEEGIWIGKWLCEQRKRYRRECGEKPLTTEQIQRLEQIGMDWMTPQETAWEKAYEKAEQYFQQTGSLKVPRGYLTNDGFRLDLWLKRQKLRYRNQTISKTQKEKLEVLGIGNVCEK